MGLDSTDIELPVDSPTPKQSSELHIGPYLVELSLSSDIVGDRILYRLSIGAHMSEAARGTFPEAYVQLLSIASLAQSNGGSNDEAK